MCDSLSTLVLLKSELNLNILLLRPENKVAIFIYSTDFSTELQELFAFRVQ